MVGGQPRPSLARLNKDGTLDTSFDANVRYIVKDIIRQPNGKILIGGGGTFLTGERQLDCLSRLNEDGTLDFNFGFNADSVIQSLALQSNGKILVSGSLTDAVGKYTQRLIRFNENGTLDESFNVALTGLC